MALARANDDRATKRPGPFPIPAVALLRLRLLRLGLQVDPGVGLVNPYGQTSRTGPSAGSYDGSEKLPVSACAGSIRADELEANACLRHGIR